MTCGYDAENQLLPIAYALVDEESFPTWGWFMRWLRIEVIGNKFMCIVSDRHIGIKKYSKIHMVVGTRKATSAFTDCVHSTSPRSSSTKLGQLPLEGPVTGDPVIDSAQRQETS